MKSSAKQRIKLFEYKSTLPDTDATNQFFANFFSNCANGYYQYGQGRVLVADTLSHRILRFRARRAERFFFQSEYECHMQPELGFGVEEI